jgi:hypothetical protein
LPTEYVKEVVPPVTDIVYVTYAPPPPPLPPFWVEFRPPPPPAPHIYIVTFLAPDGATFVPDPVTYSLKAENPPLP